LSGSLAATLFILSFLSVTKNYDSEKISPYECGFDPFFDTRLRFEVRFYVVAILFIIFDLEVVFLFPWAINVIALGLLGFFLVLFFLVILSIGFAYEWVSGALDWE
jgi:NADH:ubiquinone oxidoreductase subunit 3 (subunit A)